MSPVSNPALLLAQYAREIDCYMRVRDATRPVALRLIAALDQYLRHRDDAELLNQARALRQLYRERQERVRSYAEGWETARGASQALWSMVSAMSLLETREFDALVARDRALAEERAEFEALTVRLRGLLLLFEEVVV